MDAVSFSEVAQAGSFDPCPIVGSQKMKTGAPYLGCARFDWELQACV
ncbi:hypothetical protein Z948_1795 [Sulfitobacter donghicola DSW-25 = KCTC 12864 = JCM 14565]|nr:hypothetical protein Z948_1795 [Sulfitobacter donghicola DSW-25 = KCTC 12864 = JCM 14565]